MIICQGLNLQHGSEYSQTAFVELCGRLGRSGFDPNPTVADVGLWGVPGVVEWGVRPDTPCNARPALRERIRSALLPKLILVILPLNHTILSFILSFILYSIKSFYHPHLVQ